MSFALKLFGQLRSQRGYWGNTTLVALDAFALSVAQHIGSRPAWLFAFALICASGLGAWIGNTRRHRMIFDMPTSRIASAAQGYVELSGRVRQHPDIPVFAKLSMTPCVWYRYQIEKKDSDGDWCVDEYGASDQTFILDDGSGTCVVDPDGAEITTSHKETWTKFDRRYTEYLLLPDDGVYALGEFATLSSEMSPEDFRREVGDLLAEWKADKPNLLGRFDADGNGEIDMQEWEKVRQAAVSEMTTMQRDRSAEGPVNMLRRPQADQPFLLSNLGDARLSRRYRLWSWAHLAIFVFGCVGLAFWALR